MTNAAAAPPRSAEAPRPLDHGSPRPPEATRPGVMAPEDVAALVRTALKTGAAPAVAERLEHVVRLQRYRLLAAAQGAADPATFDLDAWFDRLVSVLEPETVERLFDPEAWRGAARGPGPAVLGLLPPMRDPAMLDRWLRHPSAGVRQRVLARAGVTRHTGHAHAAGPSLQDLPVRALTEVLAAESDAATLLELLIEMPRAALVAAGTWPAALAHAALVGPVTWSDAVRGLGFLSPPLRATLPGTCIPLHNQAVLAALAARADLGAAEVRPRCGRGAPAARRQ